jgi:TolA-binding protein
LVRLLLAGLLMLSMTGAVSAQPAGGRATKADEDYYMANFFYGQKKWIDAAEAFSKFVRAYPADKRAADAQFGNGQSLYQLGKFKEAADAFQSLLDTYPASDKKPAVLFQLGQAQLNGGQLDAAVTAFSQVTRQFPTHYLAEWADAMAASCLITKKQFAKAEPLLAPLVAKYITDKDAAAQLTQKRAALTEINPQLVDSFDEVLETAHLNLGLALMGQDKHDLAAKQFTDFLTLHPKSKLVESARFHSAQAMYLSGKFAEAAVAYDQVLAGKGPLAETASFDKALAIYHAGDLKKAAEAFVASARDYPRAERAGRARLFAGTCFYETADYDAAINQFDAVIQSDAAVGVDEARYWKGQSLLKLKRPAEASAVFTEAIKAHPNSDRLADLKLVQADSLLAEGKLADAATVYQDVVSRFPQNASAPRALYNAALALHNSKQYKESAKLCEKFTTDYPADKFLPRVLFIAGENQFLLADYAAAAPLYRQLLDKFSADASPDCDKARLRLGWACYFQKQYTEAMPPLASLGDKTDELIRWEASYLKANCLLELKDDVEASKALEAYVATGGPKVAYADDALFKLALIYLRSKQPDKAEPNLARLVKEMPESTLRPQAEYQLGEMALAAHKPVETLIHYQEVIKREPKGPLAAYAAFGVALSHYDQGQFKEAADAFASVANFSNNEKLLPQAIYRQGLSFQKLEQWAVAEKAFNELVARFPKDPYAASALRAVGLGLEKQKFYDKAAETFTRLIKEFPDNTADMDDAYYELAWCYESLKDNEKMMAAFKMLADKFPTSPLVADAYYHLGEQHYAKKEYDKAASQYQSCLAAAKDDSRKVNALYRLGWCSWLTGKYEDAAERFDKVVNEYPSSDLAPDAMLNSGEAYLRAGKPSAAADRLNKLLEGPAAKTFKYTAEAMLRLGEAQLALGQADKALVTFKAAKEKFPKDDASDAIEFGIGRSQFELKQYDDAIKTLNAAMESPKISGETAAKGQFYVAEAHFASGDLRAAIQNYLRVTVIYKDFPEWVAASDYQLGMVHLELARKAATDNPQESRAYRGEAVKQFQSVIDKNPQSKWADSARKQLEQLK